MKYLLVLTLALALTACGEPADNQSGETATHDSASEGEWIHDDFPAALALAEETGKPVFIDLYADWCRPCVMLSEDYFSRDDYREVLSQCVLVKINVDNNPDLAQRYRAQSIPTLILADASGTEIDRITGVMGTPEEFLPMISTFISQGL
ncbi:MAG: thioredoxin family protein [Candidatus Sabulitectum sp.]|nr:thioredoxin family protein [Candidatus Sabulitectum sp.]